MKQDEDFLFFNSVRSDQGCLEMHGNGNPLINAGFVWTHPLLIWWGAHYSQSERLYTEACIKGIWRRKKKTINWFSLFSLERDTYPRLSSAKWHNAKAAQPFTSNNHSGFSVRMLPWYEIRPATRGSKALRQGFVGEDRKKKHGASVCLSLSLLAYYNSALTKKRAMERQKDDNVFSFPPLFVLHFENGCR